jgi:hypothetical protein
LPNGSLRHQVAEVRGTCVGSVCLSFDHRMIDLVRIFKISSLAKMLGVAAGYALPGRGIARSAHALTFLATKRLRAVVVVTLLPLCAASIDCWPHHSECPNAPAPLHCNATTTSPHVSIPPHLFDKMADWVRCAHAFSLMSFFSLCSQERSLSESSRLIARMH